MVKSRAIWCVAALASVLLTGWLAAANAHATDDRDDVHVVAQHRVPPRGICCAAEAAEDDFSLRTQRLSDTPLVEHAPAGEAQQSGRRLSPLPAMPAGGSLQGAHVRLQI